LAEFSNPVIDVPNAQNDEKLSTEEIDFLLGHISERVIVEKFAYNSVLSAISMGAETPDSVDRWLKEKGLVDSQKKLSDSFISSQRSGVISRMTDLCLVTRAKEGVKVKYKLTQRGKAFLDGGYVSKDRA